MPMGERHDRAAYEGVTAHSKTVSAAGAPATGPWRTKSMRCPSPTPPAVADICSRFLAKVFRTVPVLEKVYFHWSGVHFPDILLHGKSTLPLLATHIADAAIPYSPRPRQCNSAARRGDGLNTGARLIVFWSASGCLVGRCRARILLTCLRAISPRWAPTFTDVFLDCMRVLMRRTCLRRRRLPEVFRALARFFPPVRRGFCMQSADVPESD
ncbi:hypothetical protein C8Q77DRAFT_1133250 [Trametes polyzona]|nr:hypothetical protein C8Q77DRAFT_1133250 [Trametes polyzona]